MEFPVRIPVMPGAKQPPLVPWQEFQRRPPTADELAAWQARWPDANWGGVTGTVSGLVVLDVDVRHGGHESLNGRALPPTFVVRTPSGGWHYYFTCAQALPSAVGLLPGVDVRAEGGYVLLPGSRVRDTPYEVLVDQPPAPVPDWLIDLLRKRTGGARLDETEISRLLQGVAEGERNATAARLAGHYLARGLPPGEVAQLLQLWNRKNRPPLPEQEVFAVVASIARREQAHHRGQCSAAEVEAVVRRWLLLPEGCEVVRLTLAAVVAHRFGGDPLWLFFISPPGGGKTEILSALTGIPDIYPLSSLTPQTFISGAKENKASSLLPKIDGKILVLKDFTTVLTMHREQRQAILSQLREIYDGAYSKAFGTGHVIRWSGRIGFLAGVTSVIDHHHGVYQVLGERFVQYRLPLAPEVAMAERAMDQRDQEQAMREALRTAFAGFFADRRLPPAGAIDLAPSLRREIAEAAALVVRARSGVIRESWSSREIEYVPTPEAPTRLAKQLATLAVALAVVDEVDAVADRQLATTIRVALDCIPAHRFLVLTALQDLGPGTKTSDLAERVGYPTTTVRRILEDLAALGIVALEKRGQGLPDLAALSPNAEKVLNAARVRVSATFPETSDPYSTTPPLPPVPTFRER